MFQHSSDLSRRQFMASSASALALTMASQSTLLASGNDVQTMTLGFSTYGSRGITTEEVIPLLAKTGYDAVEITSTKGFDAAPENVAASRRKLIRQMLEDSGLKLTSIMEHTSPDSNQTVNDANLERIQRAVGLIRDITDAKDVVIQTVLGGGVWEQKRNLFVEQVGRWVEKTADSDVTICIKPHRGGGMDNPEKALWIMKQLGDPSRDRAAVALRHGARLQLELLLQLAVLALELLDLRLLLAHDRLHLLCVRLAVALHDAIPPLQLIQLCIDRHGRIRRRIPLWRKRRLRLRLRLCPLRQSRHEGRIVLVLRHPETPRRRHNGQR